ncbi:hypothetical protein PsorP6_004441 [Peronosclerospora sorghi]|uniref:Uncharacterized protein n=1 Tax=Peronosclerospora sorghi TaxID=230839 RepID=A0ACC0VQ15_9STRA|nr:hypothetical protein PsorP6_004441 [Peronosclerospora sorghi]
MESPDSRRNGIGAPYYEEEFLLEACNLQWECLDLREKQLQKTWEYVCLMEKIEKQDRKYERALRRRRRQEHVNQRRKLEQEQVDRLEREKEWAKEIQKKKTQIAVKGTQTNEDLHAATHSTKVKARKLKVSKPKQGSKTKMKRIAPTTLLSSRSIDAEDPVSEKNRKETNGNESPLSVLPDDDLMHVLSHDKSSDSDVDVDRSTRSLILPVHQESPKPSPLKKKLSTPQKRFAKKIGAPPLDFDFSNAEAKRQAQAAKMAAKQHVESDDDEVESEPTPSSPLPTSKKHLKRRKDVAMDRQRLNGVVASGKRTLMAKTMSAPISRKGAMNDETSTGSNTLRKKTSGDGTVSKGMETKSVEAEGSTSGLPLKKKVNGKKEALSIKQRLANAELLARMNKMEDVNTPKVLSKKSKKIQNQEGATTLSAKRIEMQKSVLGETDVPESDRIVRERDLSISLNSSGMTSDYESPENLHASIRKRSREAEKGDGTPTKKLQFLELTKRLVRSPMPKFLRTPTPLTSPVIPSAMKTRKAVSPPPPAVSTRDTEAQDYGVRRMNSAPVRLTDGNRFGGGTSVVAGSGSFSMFDAFVNSSNGAIPRLKRPQG